MSMLRMMVDEKDARRCLSAAARSGETLREWARRHGVDGRSLQAWQRNLARRSSSGSPVKAAKLVELIPLETPTPSARYVIRVGEASVEVGDDFDAGTLRRLVELLRAC